MHGFWLLIAVFKKVTRQQIYGMPTGSVIVWFGLSYPRIFFISGANIMLFLELCKISISFLKKWYRMCYLFCIFTAAFSKECKDILLNSLSITTWVNEQTSFIGTVPLWAQLSHIRMWLVVSRSHRSSNRCHCHDQYLFHLLGVYVSELILEWFCKITKSKG